MEQTIKRMYACNYANKLLFKASLNLKFMDIITPYIYTISLFPQVSCQVTSLCSGHVQLGKEYFARNEILFDQINLKPEKIHKSGKN